MRVNLGCGSDRRNGWIDVDEVAAAEPDQVVDLERFPWPWQDDAVDAVLMRHVPERLGREPNVYPNIVKELWRGELFSNDLREAMRRFNNVIPETTVLMKVVKPRR